MGRIGIRRKKKTLRKVVQKPKRYRTKLSFADPEARRIWNESKDPTSSKYAALGVAYSSNKTLSNHPIDSNSSSGPDTINYELKVPKPKPSREARLSHSEIKYFYKLVSRYGDDYKAMERDIKRNNYQLTKAQLKKKCALFMAKYNTNKYVSKPIEVENASNQPSQSPEEDVLK